MTITGMASSIANDFAPRISVRPTETITAEYYYSFLWRYSESDAIYTGAPWPGGNGQNNYAVTVLAPGEIPPEIRVRSIGTVA